MGCCWAAAGAAGAVAGFAEGGSGAVSGWGGGGGGGTNAGGAELTGAAGAGIDDEEVEAAVVSCVSGSDEALFECGPELLPEGAAAGGGGAMLLAELPPAEFEAMIEFKCMDDLFDSEASAEVDFFVLRLRVVDSISIVVSGPVPREHWNSTREMMRATCWSKMWLITRPSKRCSCCMKRGRLSGCLARCRRVPAARRSMSKLVPIESGLSRK